MYATIFPNRHFIDTMTKILIIRFSSIGDIVLTTPVIRCVKKQLPDAEIHYLVKKDYAGLLLSNPHVHKVHMLENDLEALLPSLREEQFDQVIDLHHNLRSMRVKKYLKKVKSVSFRKLNIEKFVYTSFKINTLPRVHIVDRYMETVQSLGVSDDGFGLDYFIPEAEHVPKQDIPTSHHAGYIGIVIGAALATKKMPVHKLVELCKSIHHPIILLGGKEDRQAGDQIAAIDDMKIYNACGKFSLNESADLVKHAKLVITHDTGLMHIAAAFQKPIISIWGNTVPAFGMYPFYGSRSAVQYSVVETKKLWCRPCSKIGYDKCPQGHFKCMEKIDVQEIVALVNRYLGR